MEKNRPKFVDYILRQYYDPLETESFINWKKESIMDSNTNASATLIPVEQPTEIDITNKIRTAYALQVIIEKLYNEEESSVKVTLY